MNNFSDRIHRYIVRALCLTLVVGLPLSGAHAKSAYPDKVIRIISPWPSGGPADAVIRSITDKLSLALGQSVIVVSMPGANGMIGTAYAAKAAPDGYTLLYSNVSPMAIGPNVEQHMLYDPIKDFAPITQLTTAPQVLTVRASLPVTDLKSFIAYGKKHELNMASVGIGSASHLEGEMFRAKSGMNFTHVPYKGAAPGLMDMIGGRVDFSFFNWQAVAPFVKSGQVRVLGITSTKRSDLAPGVPPISDMLPGYEMSAWFGVEAPAGTPKPILDKLNTVLVKIIKSPQETATLKNMGFDPVGSTRAQHAAQLKAELDKYARVVNSVGGIDMH